MEGLMTELAEATARLKETVLNKADDLDEETKENIELIKRVKMDISILAQILCGKFGNCNAKLACGIGDEPEITFEIMLHGGEIFVHCPDWRNDRGDAWTHISEVNLEEAKEIAECLIEISKKEDDIRMELA